MTTPDKAIIPAQKPLIELLEAENEALRSQVAKLQERVIAYRNERAKIIQWIQWLRGHVAASSTLFEQPSYVAEIIHGPGNHDQGRSKTGSPPLW